jgi:hypothetical protein
LISDVRSDECNDDIDGHGHDDVDVDVIILDCLHLSFDELAEIKLSLE